MEPVRQTRDSPWTRMRSRRDVLKLGAVIVAGGTVAPLLAACAAPSRSEGASVAPSSGGSQAPSVAATTQALSGPITVLHEGGDPGTVPTLKKVYDDFQAQNPGVEWDIRAIPGLGTEFDRLARAALESGEPVGLVMLDGLFVRAWARDGLLADLGADARMADVLARVPERFHLAGPGEASARAFPLALSRGVQTTGVYYNKALLDQAGLETPRTIADLEAMVKPLSALGAAPLVHCSGVLLEGSGATDYATMQLLFLQGKAAMTYNGTWLLPQLQAGTPTVAFDLHAAPLPLVDGTTKAHSILAYGAFAMPAKAAASRDSVYAFLEYASRPEVDRAVVEGLQSYSPIPESNVGIHDAVAREFLPMFDNALTPLNWLWEPEIEAEINNQVQALVKGDTDPARVGKAIQAVAEELRSSGRSYYS